MAEFSSAKTHGYFVIYLLTIEATSRWLLGFQDCKDGPHKELHPHHYPAYSSVKLPRLLKRSGTTSNLNLSSSIFQPQDLIKPSSVRLNILCTRNLLHISTSIYIFLSRSLSAFRKEDRLNSCGFFQ